MVGNQGSSPWESVGMMCSCGGQNGGGLLMVTPGGGGVKNCSMVCSDETGVTSTGCCVVWCVVVHAPVAHTSRINEVLMSRNVGQAPHNFCKCPNSRRNGRKTHWNHPHSSNWPSLLVWCFCCQNEWSREETPFSRIDPCGCVVLVWWCCSY